MSGGHLNYEPRRLAEELFGWNITVDYGDDGFSQSKKARDINPLGNHELSEMCWDMLCVLHSLEWYESGDTGKSTYLEDVERFSNKWLKRTPKQRLDAYKEQLKSYAELLIEEMK